MAKLATIGLLLIISSLFVSDAYARKQLSMEEEEEAFIHSICGGYKEEWVRLRFYVQDLSIGHATPTVFQVAKADITANSPVQFGSVHVLDNLLTEGPDINSKAVGRIQGLTANADLSVFGIAMYLNFFFTAGKLNGSTLSILGRNQVSDDEREFPIVGGSGAFRNARGYAIQTPVSYDQEANYAVLEFNLYVAFNPKLSGSVPRDMEIADMLE